MKEESSRLARLTDRDHEFILGAHLTGKACRRDTSVPLGEDGVDLVGALCPEEGHLAAEHKGHGRTNQERVTLKDVHVPEARSLVHGQVAGEDAGEQPAQVLLRPRPGDLLGEVFVETW